jgi:hypothetical protein
MTSIDTNVSNYTLSELMAIVELEDLEPQDIIDNTNYFIRKYKNKNPNLSVFFQDVQSQLLQYSQGLDIENDQNNEDKIMVETRDYTAGNKESSIEGFESMSRNAIYPIGEKQVTDWYENQNLPQKDQNQIDKITDRKQKIEIFGNQHTPMKREQIATTDTFNVPVKQDSLNPNLKNSFNRFVNLDSQFRQYTNGADLGSTEYTCNLSDTLKNVIKLTLYSYQIPFSWYSIDVVYGNTCLWISDSSNSAINVGVYVPSGNYSQAEFISQLNTSFTQAGFSFPPRNDTTKYPSPPYPSTALPANTPAYYNPNNGIVTLFLADGSFNGIYNDEVVSFNIIPNKTIITFFDFTANLLCKTSCLSKSNHHFNNTLGWLMGYRLPYVPVEEDGNTAGAILDLNGPKYLILVVDDYNQNHVNNSMVSISQFSNTLKMPMYYSPDLPYTCLTPAQRGSNLSQLVNGVIIKSLLDGQTTNPQNGLLVAGKYENDYTPTQIVLPSAPRTLTNAQLYTINSINNNNNNLTNYLSKAPTSSDILAIIPVKTSVGVPTGSLLVEFSGSLQDNERVYFGPVNIDRLAVRLLDDKGNVLNLNGNDWCFTLVAECLYQY